MPAIDTNTETVGVKVNTVVKKLYLAAMLELHAANTAGAKALHRRYEVVNGIIRHDPPLYRAGGYATETEFFLAELNESRQTIYRNVRVCSLATSEEVAEYGVKRLSLAILYFIAVTKTSPEQRGDIHFELLRIEIMRDGKSMKLPLKKVSVAELEAATAALGKPAKKAKKSPAAKEIEAAVKGVKGVKANVTKTQFLVRGPIEGLKAVGLTLAKVDVPNG